MNISDHWKTIFNTLQDAILVVDPRGEIVAVNPAAEKTTGYAREELIGQSCRILNCDGCKIIGRGSCEEWCGLFRRKEMKGKKCTITNKAQRRVNIIKNATVLKDEKGEIIGAVETLTDISEMVRQQQEILALRKTFHLDAPSHGILGESPPILKMLELIDHVARTDAPVMIQGPSGTGKELVAFAVHESSLRQGKPFIRVNCSALNENLLESELFGHVKGAYTGAEKTRFGRFEEAHGGTILLDEIGEIPPTMQVKLLRVLEQKEVERVGDHRPIPVDVRIITATNRDLEKLVADGGFREDLFFRINVFPIHCPSLFERKEDIPILAHHFLQINTMKSGKNVSGITPAAMERLQNYEWPGNVRELRNAMEYALVLCSDRPVEVEHLPPRILARSCECLGPEKSKPKSTDKNQQRQLLIKTLKETGGNRSEAARRLGVSRVTLWKRIKKMGIDIETEVVG